jgi:hypothetical protein
MLHTHGAINVYELAWLHGEDLVWSKAHRFELLKGITGGSCNFDEAQTMV